MLLADNFDYITRIPLGYFLHLRVTVIMRTVVTYYKAVRTHSCVRYRVVLILRTPKNIEEKSFVHFLPSDPFRTLLATLVLISAKMEYILLDDVPDDPLLHFRSAFEYRSLYFVLAICYPVCPFFSRCSSRMFLRSESIRSSTI